MRFRAILYHGADECWGGSGDELLSLLMASNRAIAKERQGPKGRCDGGVIFQDGAKIYTLRNEHWTRVWTKHAQA